MFALDGWDCRYCDDRLCQSTSPIVDHKVPVCQGGSDEMENLVACCRWCNNAKGNMPYQLFVSIREKVATALAAETPSWA